MQHASRNCKRGTPRPEGVPADRIRVSGVRSLGTGGYINPSVGAIKKKLPQPVERGLLIAKREGTSLTRVFKRTENQKRGQIRVRLPQPFGRHTPRLKLLIKKRTGGWARASKVTIQVGKYSGNTENGWWGGEGDRWVGPGGVVAGEQRRKSGALAGKALSQTERKGKRTRQEIGSNGSGGIPYYGGDFRGRGKIYSRQESWKDAVKFNGGGHIRWFLFERRKLLSRGFWGLTGGDAWTKTTTKMGEQSLRGPSYIRKNIVNECGRTRLVQSACDG